MAVVFVHGVPDTERVWRPVLERLGRKDATTLSLPGFGRGLPAGFQPTKEGYVEWLGRELAAIPGPLDVVGHDWGALLVLRNVCLRPELVRTWAVGAAPVDPEYVWHQGAQMWQTPGLGEQVMAGMTPEAMTGALIGAGVPPADAEEASRHVDDTMKQCILTLYRSAVNVGTEWKGDLSRVTAPGLVLWGDGDPFAEPRFGARLAENTGARFVSFDCGHWWQLERPDAVVAELKRLWAKS